MSEAHVNTMMGESGENELRIGEKLEIFINSDYLRSLNSAATYVPFQNEEFYLRFTKFYILLLYIYMI